MLAPDAIKALLHSDLQRLVPDSAEPKRVGDFDFTHQAIYPYLSFRLIFWTKKTRPRTPLNVVVIGEKICYIGHEIGMDFDSHYGQ